MSFVSFRDVFCEPSAEWLLSEPRTHSGKRVWGYYFLQTRCFADDKESLRGGIWEDDIYKLGFPGGASGKEPLAEETWIPGSGRSPGGGHGNPLQYSCLENPMNRGAWQATVHEPQRVGHD